MSGKFQGIGVEAFGVCAKFTLEDPGVVLANGMGFGYNMKVDFKVALFFKVTSSVGLPFLFLLCSNVSHMDDFACVACLLT